MKRAIVVGVISAALVAGVVIAAQGWQDDQDGDNFTLSDVASIQVNNGVGTGTRCAQFDSSGNLLPSSAACAAGAVSSVTGTAQHISATPTTGAVIVDTIGGYSTGAVTGGNVNMGALASGVNEQVTTAGEATPLTYQCTAGDVQFGAASGGGLAQDSNYYWDASNHRLGIQAGSSPTQPLDVNGTVALGTHTTGIQSTFQTVEIAAGYSFLSAYPNGGTNSSEIFTISPRGTGQAGAAAQLTIYGTDFVADHTNYEFAGFRAIGSGGNFVVSTGKSGTGTNRSLMLAAGYLTNNVTNANQLLLNPDGTVELDLGELLPKAIAAPSTPAAGFGAIYEDSTSTNFCLKNAAGTVNHGAQTQSSVSGVALTGLADNGSWTTQSFTAPGTAVTCGQLPALTGAITSTGGTCATSYAGMPTAGQIDISAGTTSAPVGDANFTYNTSTHAFTSAGQNFLGSLTGVAFLNSGAVQTTTIGSGLKLVGFTLSNARTTHDYFIADSLTAAISSGEWAETSRSTFPGTALVSEIPNDFIAGHVAARIFLQSCVGSGTLNCFETMNSGAVSGTNLALNCTSAPVDLSYSAAPTGSSLVTDTFGLECSGTGISGLIIVFSAQVVLTP